MASVLRVMLRASDPWRRVETGVSGATVTAQGATVYYRSIAPVDAVTNDGSIAAGSSATLTGSWWFATTADRADVEVVLLDPSVSVGSSQVIRAKIFGDYPVAAEHLHHAGGNAAIAATSGNTRMRHRLLVDALAFRFLYVNWGGGGGEVDGVAAIDVWSAHEIAATGTVVPLTFNGNAKATIDPGADRWTDWMPIDQALGTILWSRTHVETVGASFPATRRTMLSLSEGTASGSGLANLALAGSAAIGASNNFPAYSPCLVQVVAANGTTRTWVAILGDSIGDGAGDTLASVADRSYIIRACERDNVPNVAVTRTGDSAVTYGAIANSRRRRRITSDADYVFCQYGFNDIANGATLATTQASVLAVWTAYANRSGRVITQTITPKTSSTDFWVSLANQTSDATNPVRLNYNAWIRDGAPIAATTKAAVAVGTSVNVLRAGQTGHPLSVNSFATKGYVEIADAVESARDSGKWKVPGATGTGDTTISTANITNFVGNIATGQIVVGAGIPSGGNGAMINSGGGTATLVMNTNATATATGVALASAFTADGVHPCAAMHDLMRDAIPAGLFA